MLRRSKRKRGDSMLNGPIDGTFFKEASEPRRRRGKSRCNREPRRDTDPDFSRARHSGDPQCCSRCSLLSLNRLNIFFRRWRVVAHRRTLRPRGYHFATGCFSSDFELGRGILERSAERSGPKHPRPISLHSLACGTPRPSLFFCFFDDFFQVAFFDIL